MHPVRFSGPAPGAPNAPGFDAPLDLLRACHVRILNQLDTLTRLVEHLRRHGLDDDARVAARQVHHYFSTAGRHHHEDEEDDLFPVLARDGGFGELLARLRADHAEMNRAWARLEPLLAEPERIADLAELARSVAGLRRLYEHHIASENGELLPKARALLNTAQLRELGARMAARRGVTLE